MELSRFDTATGSEEGRWIEPVGFDGKPIGIRIKVAGPDSRRYAELKDALQRELYNSLATISNGLEPKKEETESVKESRFYAGLTLDWEPCDEKDPIMWNGKPFPFSEKNANTLYLSVAIIRNQVKAFCESRKNFITPERAG
jgi:hypothetical protein